MDDELPVMTEGEYLAALQGAQAQPAMFAPASGNDIQSVSEFIGGPLQHGIVETAKGGLRGLSGGLGLMGDALRNISAKLPGGGAIESAGPTSDWIKSGIERLAGQSIDATPASTPERYAGNIAEALSGTMSMPLGKLKEAAKAGALFGVGSTAGEDLGLNGTITGLATALTPTAMASAGKGIVKRIAGALEGQAPKLENSSYGVTKADLTKSAANAGVGPQGQVKLADALEEVKARGTTGKVTDVAADRASANRAAMEDLSLKIDDVIGKLDARRGAMKIKPKDFPQVRNYLKSLIPSEAKRLGEVAKKEAAGIVGNVDGSFASLNAMKRKYWSVAYNEQDKAINGLYEAFGSDLRQLIEDKAANINKTAGWGTEVKTLNKQYGEHATVGKIFEREETRAMGEDFFKATLPRIATTGGSIVGPGMAFGLPGAAMGALFSALNTPIGRRVLAKGIRSGAAVQPKSLIEALQTTAPLSSQVE